MTLLAASVHENVTSFDEALSVLQGDAHPVF